MTIRDNRDYIRVLLYSYNTTITGWGGPPKVLGLGLEGGLGCWGLEFRGLGVLSLGGFRA